MTAAPVIAPRALRDLDAALSFMGEHDARLDGAFRDGFAKAVRTIAADGIAGGVMPDLERPDVRFVPVSFFSWMVVYVVDADGPARILRVIDACREAPGDVSAVFGDVASGRVSAASKADDGPVRIKVFVSPELEGKPMGEIDRRPDESDEQYEQRAKTVRAIFGER